MFVRGAGPREGAREGLRSFARFPGESQGCGISSPGARLRPSRTLAGRVRRRHHPRRRVRCRRRL
eukprot:4442489-Lingulodinium_polyedra.AAC.1